MFLWSVEKRVNGKVESYYLFRSLFAAQRELLTQRLKFDARHVETWSHGFTVGDSTYIATEKYIGG